VQPISRAKSQADSVGFNPHRPFRAGATHFSGGLYLGVCPRFNPHRPFRAGATEQELFKLLRQMEFQSSPALSGRCNGDHAVVFDRAQFVSILTGPFGPVQLSRHGPQEIGG